LPLVLLLPPLLLAAPCEADAPERCPEEEDEGGSAASLSAFSFSALTPARSVEQDELR
jgi:hypothetical protein